MRRRSRLPVDERPDSRDASTSVTREACIAGTSANNAAVTTTTAR